MPSEEKSSAEEKTPPLWAWGCRTLSICAAAAAFYTGFTWTRGEAAFEKLELAMRPRNVLDSFTPAEPAQLMALLRKAEELRPRSPYFCEMAGDFFFNTGETELAAQLYERSLSYVPGRPAAHRRMALIACRRGDMEAARRHLAQARKLFPADPKNQEKRFFEEFERSREKSESFLNQKSL